MITEIPLMIFGSGMIIFLFWIFVTFNNLITEMSEEETKKFSSSLSSDNTKIVLSIMVGASNGLFIFVFSEIYRITSNIVVDWENHLYESDKQNSYIVKTFVFNFFVSYINLFYYAFILKDFALLSRNYISIMISKNLIFILKTNIVPYLLFKFKKKKLLTKWKTERVEKKI